jgi:4-amino-4-deoxy-L-arabinose transferase-like glycosyltransferase
MKKSLSLLAWTAVLLLAAAVRLSPLLSAKPYMAYIDEGNYLHSVVPLLRHGGWDPRWYMYPQLPVTTVTAAARLYGPVYKAVHGRTIRQDLSIGRAIYDDLEPFELMALGRVLSALMGLGVVVLTGVFARRLAGPAAGLFAAFLAALTPALAIRGAIATVDPYATFFVLACLYFTDRARTSSRPGLESLAAGAMAGLAFASKYPAVSVLSAFALTMILERISWTERIRRGVLAGAGAVLGAIAGMPAVVLHPRDVLGAIHTQAVIYAHLKTEVLWKQAFLRAEWDIPYNRPELGFTYLALAAAGVALALWDRRLRGTVCGWLLFTAVCLVLYGRQSFQAFRNLLPLVPLACIAVTILYARIRERLRRPLWADAAAVALVILLYGIPLAGYARERLSMVDPRKEAVDWLVANTGPQHTVLFVRELAFVKSEAARLRSHPVLRRWAQALPSIRARRPHFIVAGVLQKEGRDPIDIAAIPMVRRGYKLRARFGVYPTPANEGWWRGNQQIIYVLERKAKVRRPQPPGALPGAQRPPGPAEAARRGAGRRSSGP